MANQWVLTPILIPKEIEASVDNKDHVSESEDLDKDYGSDDSVTDFERSLKEMLPSLKVGISSSVSGTSVGTRKSERSKKPSSR